MKKSLLSYIFLTMLLVGVSWQYGSGQTYHILSGGSFSQDWSNTDLITASDAWSGVPSIIGYRGDNGTATTGVDPQTVLIDLSSVVDVNANQTDGSLYTTGGLTEFHLVDPVVGFAGSGTADAPCLVIFVNTTGCSNVMIKYDLRDIDGSTDDAIQAVALQYRIGTSGDYTNIPSGFVADASSGPSLATLVTHVNVLLPSACYNQAEVQLRIITTNALGNDEYIGIDNIVVLVDDDGPIPTFNPVNYATDVSINIVPTITFDEPVRKTDGNALENSDLASLVTFKKTNASGAAVPFTATIDAGKKVVTVTPSSALDNSQVYYLAMGSVEDILSNESTGSNVTFTTISAAVPTVTLTYPAGGETFYAGDATVFTWTSANITNVKFEAWVVGNDRTWKWETMVASTPAAAGSLNFTVPADALYGTQYQIRISDASNAAVNSTSGSFTCIAVATSITDLRARCIVNDIVKLSSEATATFVRTVISSRNQKYVQDANSGLLIDDPSAVLTTVVASGDNIKNLEGKLGLYGGVLQIVPTKSSVLIASSGNTVTIPEMTLTEYNTNFATYESRLIKLTDAIFPVADGSSAFAAATNYDLTDGTTTIKFRTFLSGETSDFNIVTSIIPIVHLKMTCIGAFYNATVQVYSRTTNDFEFLTVGMEKLSSADKIRMYPVPASSVLNISNVPNLRSIEILDVAGKVIQTINTSSDELIQVPVTKLHRGMYMIRFNTTEGKVVKRFVKS